MSTLAAEVGRIRSGTPDITCALGALLDQLALAAETERNPSPRDPLNDRAVIAGALAQACQNAGEILGLAQRLTADCKQLARDSATSRLPERRTS